MTSFTNCALETPLQASNGAILEVLRSFEDSVVVVGNLRRYFVLPNEGAYLVRQHIECSDTRLVMPAVWEYHEKGTPDEWCAGRCCPASWEAS